MKENEYSIDVQKKENIGDIIHEDNMNILNIEMICFFYCKKIKLLIYIKYKIINYIIF
jgi:hypothetical protein